MKIKNYLLIFLIISVFFSNWISAAKINWNRLKDLEQNVNKQEKKLKKTNNKYVIAGIAVLITAGISSFMGYKYYLKNKDLNKAKKRINLLELEQKQYAEVVNKNNLSKILINFKKEYENINKSYLSKINNLQKEIDDLSLEINNNKNNIDNLHGDYKQNEQQKLNMNLSKLKQEKNDKIKELEDQFFESYLQGECAQYLRKLFDNEVKKTVND
ncbi:hypothetical protein GF322_02375 [Candidatus Dependentiae bacterium]|nr:hypothetical protein [Candidatus Dependentiae bacterium]